MLETLKSSRNLNAHNTNKPLKPYDFYKEQHADVRDADGDHGLSDTELESAGSWVGTRDRRECMHVHYEVSACSR